MSKLDGLDALTDQLQRMAQEMPTQAQATIMGLANGCVARMKAAVPVDTGELRDSITATAIPGGVEIKAGAEHGWFIEYGTIKMAAQPFFDFNADMLVKQVPASLDLMLNKVVK